MSDEVLSVHYLNLPTDSQVPRQCRTLTISPRSMPPPLSRRLFEPDGVCLETIDQKRFWCQWVAGHQHLLFYRALAAEACQNITYFVQRSNWRVAALWMRRATRLMLGAGGAEAYVRSFDISRYGHLVKGFDAPGAFSDELSNELRFLNDSIEEVNRFINASPGGPKPIASEFVDARPAFDHARSSLVSDRITSERSVRCLVRCATQIPTGETYDRVFGVLRAQTMFVEDYRFYLMNVIADAHKGLRAECLPLTVRASMERGDRLMMAIIEELLDPPTYRPNA